MLKHTTSTAGFTLVELVVLMIIAGILSAYILPRISQRATFDERVFKDEIISSARYAQQLAMMRGRGYSVRFHLDNNAKNYGIDSRQGVAAYRWLAHANSASFPLNYPPGVSSSPASVVINYDALGNIVGGVAQSITISGAASSIICIDASGFAHRGAC